MRSTDLIKQYNEKNELLKKELNSTAKTMGDISHHNSIINLKDNSMLKMMGDMSQPASVVNLIDNSMLKMMGDMSQPISVVNLIDNFVLKMMGDMSQPTSVVNLIDNFVLKMMGDMSQPTSVVNLIDNSMLKMMGDMSQAVSVVNLIDNSVFKLIGDVKNESIWKFYSNLTTGGVSHFVEQAEAINFSSIWCDLDKSELDEFKAYSQNALSSQPEQLIAVETANPSKYGNLFAHCIVELFKMIISAYIGILMSTHQAQLNLPLLDNQTANTHKQVIQAAKKDVCAEQLSVCRFVTATELYVRAGAGKKDAVVDTLKFGQAVIIDAVEVNENDRDWVFINYFDKKTESYQRGWVYRRYLKRYIK